mgnify:CR=1 FL=1
MHFEEAMTTLKKWLDELEETLTHHEWLSGECVGLADVDAIPFVQRILRIDMGADVQAHPRVNAWFERYAQRPAFLAAMPPIVATALEPVATDVIVARSGFLLWVGGLVGLWTVGSLIETIRDILRRAYGTRETLAYWRYRLISTGVIVLAVIALLFALLAQVAIGTAQEVIQSSFPRLYNWISTLGTSRLVTTVIIYSSLYLLFFTLTPSAYRSQRYPKWPGALLVTVWWSAVSAALPAVLHRFFTYDLTYGSLAGVMIALFFFWLVGLGMVVGAELNAALAVTPEEGEMIGGTASEAGGTRMVDRNA